MSEIKQTGDLQINQDLKFQKKEWSIERIGWIIMLIIAAATFMGLFGDGPLSNVTAENGSLRVKYGRFERILAGTELMVRVDSQLSRDGELRLQVGRDLLGFYNIWSITPEPENAELSPDHITYTFITGQDQGSLLINFDLQANRSGIARGEIGIENGPTVNVTQFIYP